MKRLIAVLAALALGGCSAIPGAPTASESSTVPTPVEVTTPAQTRKPDPEKKPEVTGGPEMGTWEERDRVCALLEDEEARAIGVPIEPANARGMSCIRKDGSRLEYRLHTVSQFWVPYTRQGRWAYYADATLSGQPAGVFSDEATPEDTCLVAVGLNPDASIEVTLRTSDDPEVCGRALAVAGVIVERIARG